MSLTARIDQAKSILQTTMGQLSEARKLLDGLDFPCTNITLKYERFNNALAYMHEEMITNANSSLVLTMRLLNEQSDVFVSFPKLPINITGTLAESLITNYGGNKLTGGTALMLWYLKVNSGSDWDHKPKLEEMLNLEGSDYKFPIRGDEENEYYYDIWSNIHYGYVGRAAGFDPVLLQWAAANAPGAGTNDAGDVLSIKIGMELWGKYGSDLTPEQLHQAILDHKQEYERLYDENPTVEKTVTPTADDEDCVAD